MSFVRALFAILLVTVLALPAAAEKRRIVGILDVRVEGVPKDIAAKFQDDLEKQLDSRSYWLARHARVRELMASSTKWTEGCVVGPCLTEVKTQTGAALVLLASITGADNSFGYVVTLVRTDTGSFLSQDASRCEVCTVHEALAKASAAAVELVTAVPETLPDEIADTKAALERAEVERKSAVAGNSRRRNLAFAATVAGVVVAGLGAGLYYAGDRPDYALATWATGAGLAAGGLITLTF